MNYYPVLPCTTVTDLKYTYMAGDPLPFRVMLEINLGVMLVSSAYLRRDSCVVLAGSCRFLHMEGEIGSAGVTDSTVKCGGRRLKAAKTDFYLSLMGGALATVLTVTAFKY